VPILALLCACAHHPAGCAIGVPWSDCLEGTAGYNNGGGSDTREQALKVEMARKEGATSSTNATSSKASSTERLKELDGMHQQGLISDSEFARKKRAILDAM
jgi:hypothetical protein